VKTKLNFKNWVESIFGDWPQEKMPASELPSKLNNTALINPDLLNPLPGSKKIIMKMRYSKK
jgi:hypothetical protein